MQVDLDMDSLAERAIEQVGHAADQLAAVHALRQQRLRTSEREQAPG